MDINRDMKSKASTKSTIIFPQGNRRKGLAKIIDSDSLYLILGSLPGEASLALGEYYGHKRNRFWAIIARLCDEIIPVTYVDKLAMLRRHHIALWDVLYAAEREGSLDSNIRNVEPNDIVGLLQSYPNIKAIGLNGKKAESDFYRYNDVSLLPDNVRIVPLKSTSPANAQFSDVEMLNDWSRLFAE